MPFLRIIGPDVSEDLQVAFARMALPSSAREYLTEKIPLAHVLATGLTVDEVRFLRARASAGDAPGREEYPSFLAADVNVRPGAGLLSGRRDQLDRLTDEAESEGLVALVAALKELRGRSSARSFVVGSRRFDFGARTYVMGVVNVTPDSFSDGGRYLSAEQAIQHGEALVAAGADFLDIGGESTRPGAEPVPAEEEMARIIPVLEGLRGTEVPLSVDTRKPEVAKAALAAGASLVNDVTGFLGSPEMASVAAATGASCCLMHMQGTPETMQKAPHYGDLVEEVRSALAQGVARAASAGISLDRILVDPGIGFGKTFAHNLFLLRHLKDLRGLGVGILVGTSRKSFLGHLVGGKPPTARLAATLGSVAALAVTGGADIVRVHDVEEAKDAVTVGDAIRSAVEGGDFYLRPALAHSPSGS